MKLIYITIVGILSLLTACSCSNNATTSNASSPAQLYEQASPNFDGDSAYQFVKKQVDFGPRVPNTSQHVACGNYLVDELKRFGAEVAEQKMIVTAFDGKKLNARNIIGSYNLEKKNRVLLFAHWDTRPFADHDPNPENHRKHILGANDGASGVGVLLEVARVLQAKSPEVGVDIIFFDAEDYGVPTFVDKEGSAEWWCLGSQHWAKNPHVAGYTAKYGILLDMVGAKDATFYYEFYSRKYASGVVDKVWKTARQLGYGTYFVSKDGGGVTDDHVPVNQIAQIPSIDIIHYEIGRDSGFFPHWHTVNDDMNNISKETLKAVGQTVLEVVYKEK